MVNWLWAASPIIGGIGLITLWIASNPFIDVRTFPTSIPLVAWTAGIGSPLAGATFALLQLRANHPGLSGERQKWIRQTLGWAFDRSASACCQVLWSCSIHRICGACSRDRPQPCFCCSDWGPIRPYGN